MIFIGSRSPPSLPKLDERTFTECMYYSAQNASIYNWFRFKNIKSVTISPIDAEHHYYSCDVDCCPIRDEDEMEFRHLPIWNSLYKLHFSFI